MLVSLLSTWYKTDIPARKIHRRRLFLTNRYNHHISPLKESFWIVMIFYLGTRILTRASQNDYGINLVMHGHRKAKNIILNLQYTRYWIEMERYLTFIIFQYSIQTERKSYLHIEWKHRWIWMDLLYFIFTLLYLIVIFIFRDSWPWHFQVIIMKKNTFQGVVSGSSYLKVSGSSSLKGYFSCSGSSSLKIFGE